jgi:hypothetical protein
MLTYQDLEMLKRRTGLTKMPGIFSRQSGSD